MPFKKGAFHLAVHTQCPIQPVVLSKYHHYNFEQKIFKTGSVIAQFLPEISTEGLTEENVSELCDRVHLIIQNEYDRLNEETEPVRN